MKHLFLTLACLLSLIVLAQENFLPNPTFAPETIGQNGVPKGWVSSTPGATLTFKDGTVTLMHKDGKRTVFGCDLKDTTEVDVPYVFSCKVSAPQPTQARLYVESVYKVPNGGNHWVGSGAAPFEVGPEPIVRQFSYLRRAEFIDTYLAIISTEGKPLVISDLLLRKARYRDELGGRWNLEDHIEIVDNGVMVTDGKPAVLTGVPVQPGKTYRLSYNTIGVGSTGNDYPFHEITVTTNPSDIQGHYFFNDVRNDQVQPKFQKLSIPAKSNNTRIDLTFSAKTKGRVHFYDFAFGEYVPDPTEGWRLFLDNPFYRDTIYESTDAGRIAGQIAATAPAASATVDVKGVGETTIQLTDGKGTFSIPAANLPVGKYTLTCQIMDAAGKVIKTFERKLSKVPKAPMEVILRPNRYFTINGKPFFPVTQWRMSFNSETLDACLYQSARNGINSTIVTDHTNSVPKKLECLDRMHKYGIKVVFNSIVSPSLAPSELDTLRKRLNELFPPEVRNHPAFLGYFTIDEPLWGGKPHAPLAASFEIYKEFDPYHPTWINAAPRNEPEDLVPYGEACDIYGVDIYPVPYPSTHSGLDDKGITSVGKYTTRMSDITFWRKPTWMALQGFSWAAYSRNPDPNTHIYPNDTEMRFMAFDTMLNGCTGYGLWGTHHIRRTSFYDTIHKTARELHALSGLFVYGRQLADIDGGSKDVRVVPIKFGNAYYYVVMNLSSEKDAACDFAALATVESFKIYATGAAIKPVNGKVSLSLKPLEVVLFGTAPLPAPVYDLPERNAELEKVKNGNPIGAQIDAFAAVYEGGTKPYKGTAKWLWDKTPSDSACCWLATDFTMAADAKQVVIKVAADDFADIFVNGKKLGRASAFDLMHCYDATTLCKSGKNTIFIKGIDGGVAPCGVLAEILVDGKLVNSSDTSWLAKETTLKSELPKTLEGFKPAFVIAPYGQGAWGTKVNEKKQFLLPAKD